MQNFYNPNPSVSLLQVRTNEAYKMKLDHKDLPKVSASKYQPQFLQLGQPEEFSPEIPLAIAKQMLGDKISGAEQAKHKPVDRNNSKLVPTEPNRTLQMK